MKKEFYKKWWFWIIIVILLIGIIFGKNDSNIQNNDNINISNPNVNNQEIINDVKENEYAEDDIVNKFFTDFKANSNYELTDIHKGNIRTKYYANINGQSCEVINATKNPANYFEITINGGNKDEDIDKIIDICKEVVKALDPTIDDNRINEMVNKIKNSEMNYKITDSITINLYSITEVSWGKTNCRIEITTTIYN